MIIITLRVDIAPERREDFLTSARLVLGPTQILPSCISCSFYQDIEDPNVMLLIEQWDSRQDLESHISSDKFRLILSLMEASAGPPEINFYTVSRTGGIEVIEAVRALK